MSESLDYVVCRDVSFVPPLIYCHPCIMILILDVISQDSGYDAVNYFHLINIVASSPKCTALPPDGQITMVLTSAIM